MGLINTILCVLAILVQHRVLGEVNIEINDAKIICDNSDYLKNTEYSYAKEGSVVKMNAKFTIAKEIPKATKCETIVYKKVDDGFKLMFNMPPEKCCEAVLKNKMYQDMIQNGQNVPKECPMKLGDYSINDYTLDTSSYCDEAQPGEYKVEFKQTLPNGDCLYESLTLMTVTKT